MKDDEQNPNGETAREETGKAVTKEAASARIAGDVVKAGGRQVRTDVGFFSGPLPPPEVLARYNEIVPNAADRILVMAEKQAEHRQFLERTVIKSDTRQSIVGLTLAAVLALVFGLGGIYLIATGHTTDGLVAMLAPLAAVIGVFVYADRSRRGERRERRGSAKKPTEEQLSLFD